MQSEKHVIHAMLHYYIGKRYKSKIFSIHGLLPNDRTYCRCKSRELDAFADIARRIQNEGPIFTIYH